VKAFSVKTLTAKGHNRPTQLTTMTTATLNDVAHALRKLLPAKLPPTLAGRSGSLYQVLSRHPGGGVGRQVYQTRWSQKKIYDCYWEITRARFKCEGNHGKAWGKLYWRGG
jgi:small subunit ribosomal protein S34